MTNFLSIAGLVGLSCSYSVAGWESVDTVGRGHGCTFLRYQCICAQHIGSNGGTANMQCSWVYKLDDVDQSVGPYSCNFLGTGKF